jgi:hypothetical protein
MQQLSNKTNEITDKKAIEKKPINMARFNQWLNKIGKALNISQMANYK